jgi:hypothetical protein
MNQRISESSNDLREKAKEWEFAAQKFRKIATPEVSIP